MGVLGNRILSGNKRCIYTDEGSLMKFCFSIVVHISISQSPKTRTLEHFVLV